MISIVVPFFNSVRFLQETLDSLQEQTFGDWECLLVDDGSTDGSERIAQSAQELDPRFRYHVNPNKERGVSASRNLGISLATGHYLMFLDSDDLLEPTALESRLSVMQQYPELDLAFFQVQAFGLESFRFTPVLDDYLEPFLRFEVPFQTSSSFWKTSFVRSLKGFRTDMTHLEDPEFHMQALAVNPRYIVLPHSDPDVRYRVWKTKSTVLSDSLVSEIRSYVVYLKSALDISDRTGHTRNGLIRGLYLMLIRIRWAYNDEISESIRQAIALLTLHQVLSTSTSGRLLSLLNRVDPKRPRCQLELMAIRLSPREHIKAYTSALSDRLK
jgi:glycosyltransferase involved in cell wall biosynthesis